MKKCTRENEVEVKKLTDEYRRFENVSLEH